ncbi:MAG: hypothetical protein KGN79_12150 [Acidobacteriota bacterium]|nr:hypothetical protein [Acidobacteriota bacterium]
MKTWIRAFALTSACVCLCVQGIAQVDAEAGKADVFPHHLENTEVKTTAGEKLELTRKVASAPMTMECSHCLAVGVEREGQQWWILPMGSLGEKTGTQIEANSALWLMPADATAKEHAWRIELHGGTLSVTKTATGMQVALNAAGASALPFKSRPHSDVMGNRFSLRIRGGEPLEDALAGFYWGTILPSVVERTMAAHFPYHDGYVLSTLNVKSYAGSYPAVDHEFQIKGRLAMGSAVDLDVVRRMIELQFTLMRDDPERLYRAPTSVQSDGRREYHVRRDSEDRKVNAAMFPLTGNIEVIEESLNYYKATKDAAWLRAHIGDLEHAAGWTEAHIDPYGRVWSDVYYEDQVMKDGRVTQAQAFAARSFEMMAEMEQVLARQGKAEEYAALAKKLAHVLVEPLPMGYWDEANKRFVDWVDRDGKAHDHLHLLANELPVMFGYAKTEQADAVRLMIQEHEGEFERFPSFLSADVAAYTKSEIGDGGPYDLSAAGRYWYWDAAFRAAEKQDDVLLNQLMAVAAEGAKNGYMMGERYDMDHVYYIDGKDAHGAERYYEYPNVFAAVLLSKYLGLSKPMNADMRVEPRLASYGSVRVETPEYAIEYNYDKNGFALRNLADKARKFEVDLSSLGKGRVQYKTGNTAAQRFMVAVPAGGQIFLSAVDGH